jgi:hypothetical protein
LALRPPPAIRHSNFVIRTSLGSSFDISGRDDPIALANLALAGYKPRVPPDVPSKTPALLLQVEQRIFLIRGQKVMLDSDLAELYGVPTKSLNLAVKRNADRFPEDFAFQLNQDEVAGLRFQFETTKRGRGGRRYRPYAFTEQGVAMLSSVLRSPRAVQVNIAIMRTFVRLREMLMSNADLARKLIALENKYDAQLRIVFDAIRELMEGPPPPPKPRIGFRP